MFGVPKSISILEKVNKFVKSDKKFNKKYKVIVTPPHTLLQSYTKFFTGKKIFKLWNVKINFCARYEKNYWII